MWVSTQRIRGWRSTTPLNTSFGRGERRVHQEADQRHQPVVEHRLDAGRIGRMDVDDGAELVRLLPQRREALVGERDVVDVAEHHRARQRRAPSSRARARRTDAAGSFSGSVASAVNRPVAFAHDLRERVVDLRAPVATARRRRLDVHARRRERQHLRRRRRARRARAGGSRCRDGRARGCCSRPDSARTDCRRRRRSPSRSTATRPLQRLDVLGRIVVVVKVDDAHATDSRSRKGLG